MPDSLEKIIELIKSTGDNRVILDSKGNPVYVLMPFFDYQNLVNNRKEDNDFVHQKVNEDIASWKEAEKEIQWPLIDQLDTPEIGKKSANQAVKKEDLNQKYYFEPID